MSNETKKYELVKSESIVHNGRTLYRIRALREFTISRGVAIKRHRGWYISYFRE